MCEATSELRKKRNRNNFPKSWKHPRNSTSGADTETSLPRLRVVIPFVV